MNSKRRTINMIIAKSSITYNFYLSLYTTNKLKTTLPISVGSGLYFLVYTYIIINILKQLLLSLFTTYLGKHWSFFNL